MSNTIDARGLSCPQPVLDTLNKIAAMGRGNLEILVDTEASKENVCRAVQAKAWTLDSVTEAGGEYTIRISKD
ncbi:MAG: sulfurtransferase TusA family protein [Pseudodesulfovibrio sp.]|uniref:SirA-like domain-containing protein n=1 Tax=Pseudodesulfovibrio aespoeensis (strain ATCC 700646 / DSM 10631 / Aspo-2) TaxID=643562 RepID=E6VRV4_PSEA9|nr:MULTISPECIES: sulfurtransferase TusA family protein [Pseudodesulfovibrio]MBU4191781.1 sulfurtransferase TusA family protein [Pseudomonadota bacterium]ADU64241.1 SirA-like domain-containing protein [Pseudodesulfovibrio aespoeensis Aspo-2]MBU4243015.1 sulfurtransferase TusA family protein [Pseudomonadota bacterium]MBU4380290.1 sulfurtransferase TusA family protein [Pseudomonadota bacterium]MBU4474842.1 sulfurtransferase TusA family protein [Pseudomonadota bacterium]